MKTYQKPEIVLQNIEVADILTTSFVVDVDIKGEAVGITWGSF